MLRRVDPRLTARARELRNNPTPAELAIWHRVARFRPAFTRQFVEAPFIIDLVCRKARLAVEIDGTHPHPLPSRKGRERRPRYR